MSLALAFAILMLVWLVFGFWAAPPGAGFKSFGGNILIFLLFLLLGWQVFGPLLHR
jgi:hypothetical protein